MKIAGVIFAGGRAYRLGGVDKAGLTIGGQTCLARVSGVLSGLDDIMISGGDIPDWPIPKVERGGVIFGLLGALDWASAQGLNYIVTSSVDTPFLPNDYVSQLRKHAQDYAPVVSLSESGLHGLHALWPIGLFEAVKAAVLDQGERRISRLHETLGSVKCEFTSQGYDPFFNINTPEDLERAQRLAKHL